MDWSSSLVFEDVHKHASFFICLQSKFQRKYDQQFFSLSHIIL